MMNKIENNEIIVILVLVWERNGRKKWTNGHMDTIIRNNRTLILFTGIIILGQSTWCFPIWWNPPSVRKIRSREG